MNRIIERDKRFSISERYYRKVAESILSNVESKNYLSMSIDVDPDGDDGMFISVTVTLIIYWKKGMKGDYLTPDDPDTIQDIVPIWWEAHTYNIEGEEFPNDFQFGVLKSYMLEK